MKHAEVKIGEFTIPLIGVPRNATLEECDCCHEIIVLSEAVITDKQVLCRKCSKPNETQSKR